MESIGIFSSNRQSADNDNDGNITSSVVITIVENRAREICICKINTNNISLLELYLITDNHSYNETIGTIYDINPDEILLHDGARNRILSRKIEAQTVVDARVLYISRQYFDQDRGADLLGKVLIGDVDADLIAKYIVLSGAFCLLRYIENCSGSNFAAHSMRVVYGSGVSSKMSIDRRTAINLELISNARSGNQKESLFGAIDNTKTVVGARLLRSNILHPLIDLVTIDTRLDFVELLLRRNRVFTDIASVLTTFPDLDKLLTGLTTVPKTVTQKTARAGIDTIIYLKQALRQAAELAEVLHGLSTTTANNNNNLGNANSDYPLVVVMIQNFTDPALNQMLEEIMKVITESTKYTKSAHEMRHQECFALQSGIHGLLDVARKTFLQTVEDLYTLADKYSLEFGATMKVSHSLSRGYFLTIPSSLEPLPAIFTQAVLNKRTISCSTEEFTSLSNRAQEAIMQALILTHELIQDLLERIREHIDCLFVLTDSVALLDMLSSFADLVALSPHTYTRPIIRNDGPIVIKAGRHPVISMLTLQQMASSFVPNDVFVSPLENIHIITGPNGSGKTVYIKQIALLIVMAQIGCFVPARHATIPIRDRLLSRLGTSDDMEHNMSTFFTEMKESAYLLNNLTNHGSLVIIDELGRGTSTIDGLSIAFAIAEELLHTNAMTLFVTHYPQITSLANMYSNVKNVHLKTSIDAVSTLSNNQEDNNAAQIMHFLHEISSGPCDMKSGYGIIMAEQCGFPKSVLQQARTIRRTVRNKFPLLLDTTSGIDTSARCATKLLQHLLLLKNSTLDNTSLCHYLQGLRSRVTTSEANNIILWIKSSTAANSNSFNDNNQSHLNNIANISGENNTVSPIIIDNICHGTDNEEKDRSSDTSSDDRSGNNAPLKEQIVGEKRCLQNVVDA